VVERLNSLLENDPTFALTEDLTVGADGKTDMVIPSGFQVFATIHAESGRRINVSPATKSRFTVIFTAGYSDDDLHTIFAESLIASMPPDATAEQQIRSWARHLFTLRTHLLTLNAALAKDVHRVFHIADFLRSPHNADTPLPRRFALAFRYMLMGELGPNDVESTLKAWNAALPPTPEDASVIDAVFAVPSTEEELKAMKPSSGKPDEVEAAYNRNLQRLAALCLGHSDIYVSPTTGSVKLVHCGLQLVPKGPVDEERRMAAMQRFTKSPSLLNNLARIWAGIAAGRPVLLTGPPGTGKTAVVMLAAAMLGAKVERINMSGSTTLDQLIGSVVPTVENGQRIFKQRDGKVVQAIKEKSWVLLDELNLCPPEVLDGLTPFLRDRNLHVFATMNPASIGGGRSKLPRSIRSLFTGCNVEALSEHETCAIFLKECQSMVLSGSLTFEAVMSMFAVHKVQRSSRRARIPARS
jgi:MoxR-like ATPase